MKIGLTGPISGGKGVLASYLKKFGFLVPVYSDEIKLEAATRGITNLTREDLQNLGNELRKDFGSAVLMERVLSKLPPGIENIAFDGMRNPGEIILSRLKFPDIVIIGADAPVDLRITWWIQRALERKEDDPTEAGFYKADARDRGEGEAESGQQVAKCLEMADVILINDDPGEGGKEKFRQKLRTCLIENYGFDIEGAKIGKELKR